MSSPRGSNDPSNGRLKEILIEADMIIFLDKDIDFTVGFGSSERLGAKKIIVLAEQNMTIEHAKKMLKERIILSYEVGPINAINSICELEYECNLDWINLVKELIAERPPASKRQTSKILPSKLCEIVVKQTLSKNTLFFSDGGEFGQWAQSRIPLSNMFTNGPSGAIGGATPQSIGASFANPGNTIVSFMGDGTAGFQIAEWETARRYNLPIIFVIGNDRRWGAEVEIQIRDYGNDRAKFCYLDEITRYDIIAQGLGCEGFYIKSENELEKALNTALLSKKTTVLDVQMEGLPAPEF
jgi:acetolactate synthase-1/2/3 large subunit